MILYLTHCDVVTSNSMEYVGHHWFRNRHLNVWCEVITRSNAVFYRTNLSETNQNTSIFSQANVFVSSVKCQPFYNGPMRLYPKLTCQVVHSTVSILCMHHWVFDVNIALIFPVVSTYFSSVQMYWSMLTIKTVENGLCNDLKWKGQHCNQLNVFGTSSYGWCRDMAVTVTNLQHQWWSDISPWNHIIIFAKAWYNFCGC